MTDWRGAFAKTIEALHKQGLGSLAEGFEYELRAQQLRLDLRWFPVFLKMQNCPARLQALAEFEYLRAQVISDDLGSARTEPGFLRLNPSAQFLEVNEPLPEIGRGPGLYCMVKAQDRFLEMDLSLPQALLLDLLQEDRKFRPEQLIEQAQLHSVRLPLSREEWRRTLNTLIERGVISHGGTVGTASTSESHSPSN